MTIMKALLHHPSLIAAIWLLAVAASGVHGALNFKIFNDPKSVFTKEGKSSCTSAAVACVPVDIDALAAGEMLKAQDKEDYCLLKHYSQKTYNSRTPQIHTCVKFAAVLNGWSFSLKKEEISLIGLS